MLSVLTRYSLIVASATIALTVFVSTAHADRDREYTVFDVRKSLPLHDEDKVFKDYYLNMGADAGVKVGSVLAVYRKVPVIDVYRNKAQGDLVIPVAHLKVIHVQRTMSVARITSVSSLNDIPVVDYEAVMTGDHVDFAAHSSFGSGKGAAAADGDDGDDDDDDSGTAVKSAPVPAPAVAPPMLQTVPQAAPEAKPAPKKTGHTTAASEAPPAGVSTQLPQKVLQAAPQSATTPAEAKSNVQINSNI